MNKIAGALRVRPGEVRTVALLIAVMVSTSAGGSIGGNAIDALFISRFGVHFLPHMYIALGFVTLVTSLIVAVLLARFARHKLFVFLPLAIAAALVGERLLVGRGLRWVYPLLWLGMNVKGALQGLFTWGLAGIACDTRQAKRLFPVFGAGNILGAVIGGLATPKLAALIHSENLLLVWAGAAVAAFLFGRALTRRGLTTPDRKRRARASFAREMRRGFETVRNSPFLSWTAAGAALFAVLLYSIAFPFSKAAAARFTDADALAGFFGVFQGVSTGLAFLVSLFIANRLFARVGIMKTIAAFPVVYALGFAALLGYRGFPAIAGFRFIQMVCLQGVFFSAYQAAFNVIPPDRKDQARAFIDGVPGQAGTVAAGVLLLVGERSLPQNALFAVGLAAAGIAGFVAIRSVRAYGGALVDALREGRPQVFITEDEPFGGFQQDADAVSAAVSGTRNPDRAIRRVSVEILGQLRAPEATGALVRSLKDRDPPVRMAALRGLVRSRASEALLEIAARLYDPEPDVRAEAVAALGQLAIDPSGVAREIRRLLNDPDHAVRARVAATLVATEQDPAAASTLESMASSDDDSERLAFLSSLSISAHSSLAGLVIDQIRHRAAPVRRAAARAVSAFGAATAVPVLLEMITDDDPTVIEVSATNLARFPDSVPKLLEGLNDPVRGPGALRALELVEVPVPADVIREFARSASQRSVHYRDLWLAARNAPETGASSLLAHALRERALGQARLAIRAVGIAEGSGAVAVALDNLESRDAAQRANAIETLEAAGHREVVGPLVALWDPEGMPPPVADGWLMKALSDDDPWIRSCAVLVAHGSDDPKIRDVVERLAMADPDEAVREAAGRMTGHDMETLATLSPIERVLFLRKVPLFMGLSPDELKQLSGIAAERTYSDGEVIAEEGGPGDELYIVISGEIGVLVGLGEKAETELARRGVGDYVGEMAVVTGGARSASLVARGAVRCLCLEQRHFEALLRERPEVSLTLMRALVERIQEANRFLPRELAAKLETARHRGSMVGERRVVTMLFCDVTGSTQMAEQLDPEDWAQIMNTAFEILVAPVYRYEGTLARVMGDAILAFFGAPLAHEDDPVRAVRAGLEMIRDISSLRRELLAARGLDFNLRVGINTGLVVVGEVGSDLRLEYTALGDAINIAARMEQLASPGTVQISEATQKLIGPFFETEDLGLIEAKGKREPLHAFRVTAARAEPEMARGLEGMAAPLVGRDQEMSILRDRLEALRSGKGQIVCLVGEAGLGKSRLISEAHRHWHLQSAGGDWAESRAASYDMYTPYGQVQQYVRFFIGATLHDSPEEVRSKVARAVDDLGSAGGRSAKVFEILLGVEEGDASLRGEDLKKEVFEVFTRLLLRRSGISPFVIVADDLHWSDSASADLLTHLFSVTATAPVLMICAMRPASGTQAERIVPAAQQKNPDGLTEITLEPLSPGHGQQMLSGLLQIEDLPRDLMSMVLNKAAGNPFFIEEVLRQMIDEETLVRENGAWRLAKAVSEVSIPDRLQSLLAARIDGLEPDVRRALQQAAVIGPVFHYRVLKIISDHATDLGDHLDKLERAGLIVEVAEIPELEFAFRHPLIQEAAYDSILMRDRAALHLKAGEELERMAAGREAEEAGTLVRHFFVAGDPRAIKYCTMAGDRAARLYAHPEASGHYSTALQLAKASPEQADFLHLYTGLGQCCELTGDFRGAVDLYDEMIALARERNDRHLELHALGCLAKVRATPNPMADPVEARRLLEEELALAREIGDRPVEGRALWNLMLNLQFGGGSVEDAIGYGEQALEIAKERGSKEQMAFVLNDIAYSYFMRGEPERATESLRQARKLWVELGNQPMLGDSTGRLADLATLVGDYQEAIRLADETYEITSRISNEWGQGFALTVRGDAYWQLGNLGRALKDKQTSIRFSEGGGFAIGATGVRSDVAWMLAQLGDLEGALEMARLGDSVAAEQFAILRPWTRSVLARVLLRTGDLAGAKAESERAVEELMPGDGVLHLSASVPMKSTRAEIEIIEGNFDEAVRILDELAKYLTERSVKVVVADVLILRAEALRLGGRLDEAAATLERAKEIADSASAQWPLWQALHALAEIEVRSGKDDATGLRAEARRIVEGLIASITDDHLRSSFESQPDVRSVMGFGT